MTLPVSLTTFNVLGTISLFLFFLLIYLWSTYNELVTKKNRVRTDFADIDVQLKRRASLIDNLVDTVKAYAKHEEETFENVARARSALESSRGARQTAEAENALTQTLRSLFAVVENYPKLQASENFQQLRTDLKETENSIAHYREEYNQTVLSYNNLVQTFPNLLVAGLFRFESEELFQA